MQAAGEVTAAEIARLAGVGRAAVSNWRKRFPDFPAPVGGTSSSPTFRLEEVERWLAANDRTPADEPRGRLRRALLTADNPPTEEPAEEITRRAQQLLAPIPDRTTDPVLRLALDIGAPATLDLLLEAYLDVKATATPPNLAALMVELAGVDGRSVHDPLCGAGNLLAAALAKGATSVTGQDADETNADMTRTRLALAQPKAKAEVRVGDLRRDAYPGERFDVVLCHPPFAVRDWGADELAYDPRWVYGVPPRQESELAWVQHALAHTRPGGVAVVVVPPAVASRPSGRRIRAELLRKGALRTVVALPPGMAAPAHLSLQLWLLTPPDGPAGTVLLVDGSTLDRSRLAATVRHPEDGGAHAARMPVVDLLDEDVDLTPARHLASRTTVASEDVLAAWERLTAMIGDLTTAAPRLAAATDPELPMTTVAELARSGALTIITQSDTTVSSGDVITPTQGTDLTAEVAAEDGGALGPGRVLLRPHPERLDPWFLAGFVARPTNVRLVSSLGSMMRLDVRRAQVPRLPLERQREYAELFRDLHTLRRNLINAAENGRKAIDLVAEGLAAGTVVGKA